MLLSPLFWAFPGGWLSHCAAALACALPPLILFAGFYIPMARCGVGGLEETLGVGQGAGAPALGRGPWPPTAHGHMGWEGDLWQGVPAVLPQPALCCTSRTLTGTQLPGKLRPGAQGSARLTSGSCGAGSRECWRR